MSAVSLFGQVDTLFWFVAPEVSAHSNYYDLPIVFRFSTLNQGATIKIEQPANPDFSQIVFELEANSNRTVDLSSFINLLENKPANQILNKGIRITSTEKISVYYEVVSSYCNCNPEVFSLKGSKAIGTVFFTPFQNVLFNRSNFSPLPFSSFTIVATENNTTVTIIPKNNIVGHTAGIPFNILLNKGQSYSAQAVSQEGGLHLHGSKATSDKPIAITIVDDLLDATIYGGCADLVGDQIIPVSRTGKEYVVTKGWLNGPDRLFIVGTKDNTQLRIGSSNVINLNEGETYVSELYDPSVYIIASENIYILQLSGHGCEVGNAIVPSLSNSGTDQVSFTRSVDAELRLLLMTRSGNEGDFLLDHIPGVIPATLFQDVPFTNGKWKQASIDFTNIQVPVGQTSVISNTKGSFQMGFIHGGEHGGCRFAYLSDFSILKCQITANKTEFCQGETLVLVADNIPEAIYQWSGPDGYANNGLSIEIPNLTVDQGGYYYLNGSIDGISIEPDSIFITIYPLPANLVELPGCSNTLQDSLIAYYPFNGNANDESGNGYNGSIFGAVPVIDRFGEADHAYHFNGYTDYISTDRPYLSEFTASLWVKLDGYQCFSGLIDAYNLSWELVMDCQSPGRFVSFASWNEDGVNYTVNVSNIQLPLDSWNHIVLTYKDNICMFYLNGNISGSLEVTSFNPVSGSFYFGSSKSGTDQFLYGDLDDIRIYKRALSDEEVFCLFKGDYSNNTLSAKLQNDHLCSGSSTLLSLFNAQTGISYQLFKENIEYGNYQIGNSDTLNFPLNILSETSSFTIQATDTATGCAITLDSTFTVYVLEVDAKASVEMSSFLVPATAHLTSQSQGADIYKWFLDGVLFGNLADSQVIIDTPGEHELVLFIQSGPPANCTDADTLRIILTETTEIDVIIKIPSSFTPNNDNVNDFFEFYEEGIESYILWIKDPWGRLINEFDQTTGKWDGTTKQGKDALAGPYYYHLSALDIMHQSHERSGVIYLIRDLIELTPNPVKSIVKVNTKGQIIGKKTIQIFSIQGVELFKEDFSNDIIEIDLSTFKSGIYIMQISNNLQDLKNLKIVKE
jgi:gliding motility-associated-like protein